MATPSIFCSTATATPRRCAYSLQVGRQDNPSHSAMCAPRAPFKFLRQPLAPVMVFPSTTSSPFRCGQDYVYSALCFAADLFYPTDYISCWHTLHVVVPVWQHSDAGGAHRLGINRANHQHFGRLSICLHRRNYVHCGSPITSVRGADSSIIIITYLFST